MGLDGSGKEVVSHQWVVVSRLSSNNKTLITKDYGLKTIDPRLLSPSVENFPTIDSLLKRTFIKPNAANGNHKRVIRTVYPNR